MKYLFSIALLLWLSCFTGLTASKNEHQFEVRVSCPITFNSNLTPDEIIDILTRCIETNENALKILQDLAMIFKCPDTTRESIICLIENRQYLGIDELNMILDILKLIANCTKGIVLDRGNLTGVEYVAALLSCLGAALGI